MATIAEALALALEHHQGGRLAEAETLYGCILDADSEQPDALHLLGVLGGQSGRAERGAELIARAMARRPDAADCPFNLGNLFDAADQSSRAAAAYRRTVTLRPDLASAWARLGVTSHRLGDDSGAVRALVRAVALDPSDGVSAERAAFLLHKAIAERTAGRMTQARAMLERVLRLRSDSADLWFYAARAAYASGAVPAAGDGYRRTLALAPDHATAWASLGAVLHVSGRSDEALAVCHRALTLNAELVAGWLNRSAACARLGRHGESAVSGRRALALDPAFATALISLAAALCGWGGGDGGLPLLRRAVHLGDATAERNLLSVILYDPTFDEEARFAENRAFAERRAAPIIARAVPPRTHPDPNRRLRIGYLSSDFRSHPLAHNMEPILANHDHAGFEIAAYVDTLRSDAMTERLRGHIDLWRPIDGLSDAAVAERIRADAIDVLVILGGRFDSNRPLVAAYRPAPVQISAYDGATSGLTVIDALFTDVVQTPRGGAERFAERPFRLPTLYAFSPIADAPPPAPPPVLAQGCVTFGSFNNPIKMTDAVLALWGRLLAAVPNARLLLRYKTFYREPTLRQRVRSAFAGMGIDPERVLFPESAPESQYHLALYHGIDIGLDTFPFSGATTTFEALWMGVPVVTLSGANMMGRVSTAHLTAIGATELIARDADSYVRIAANLAGDPDRLAVYHRTLRDRLHAAPIMNGRLKARQFERAYRALWRRWCASQNAAAQS